jgi:hypothetical protein
VYVRWELWPLLNIRGVVYRIQICRQIELDLGQADALNQSDVTTIRIACRQVAAAASELAAVSNDRTLVEA